MKIVTLIILILLPNLALATDKADLVLVIKSEAKLFLVKNDKVFKAYKAAFGPNSRGHKQMEGDKRTPEGNYVLDYKKEKSPFYKSIHISYPNEEDRKRAEAAGVDPGGAIMIHGRKKASTQLQLWAMENLNWTEGCIAVSNSAMDDIWEAVDIGTPIEIRP